MKKYLEERNENRTWNMILNENQTNIFIFKVFRDVPNTKEYEHESSSIVCTVISCIERSKKYQQQQRRQQQ